MSSNGQTLAVRQNVKLGRNTIRRRIAMAAVVGAGLAAAPTWADTFTYSRDAAGTDLWSDGTNWSPEAPESSNTTILNFNGTLPASNNVTSNNDIGTFQLNQLNFNYTGPASGTAPIVSITGGQLQFASNGATTPTLNVNTSGTVRPTLVIAAPVEFTNNTTLTLNSATTFAGAITGTGTITKTGIGTLVLNTASAGGSSYGGQLIINDATVSMSFAALSSSSSNILGPSTALSMGSLWSTGVAPATLNLVGRATNGVVNSQTFTGTTIQSGRSQINVTRGAAGNTIAGHLGALTRQTAGLVNFASNHDAATLTTSNALTNGILGAWATMGSAFATVNNGTIAPYTGYTSAASAIADAPTANLAVTNSTAGQITLAATGTTNLYTLSLPDVAGREIVIGSGNRLRLGTVGAVWRNVSALTAPTFTISGGELTAGGPDDDADGELILRADGTVSSSSLNQVFNTISSNIVDNGAGTLTLTKSGQQGINLTGNNSYTGNTYILQGTLQASSISGFASSDVYVSELGQAYLSAAGTYTNKFFIAGNGPSVHFSTVQVSAGALRLGVGTTVSGQVMLMGDGRIAAAVNNSTFNAGATVSGQITGKGNLAIGAAGQQSSNIMLTNTSNNWDGDLIINLSGNSSGAGIGVLHLGASGVIPDASSVTISYSGNQVALLQLNGFSEAINGLNTSGTFLHTDDDARQVRNTSATSATLTIGSAGGSGSFLGVTANGTGGGTLSITKVGDGTQTFSGRLAHTGVTRVEGGVLEMDYRQYAITPNGGDNMTALSTIDLAGGTFRVTGRNTGGTMSENVTYSTVSSIAVSSTMAAQLSVGQTISAPGFNSSAYIKHINGTTVVLSSSATGFTGSRTETISFVGADSGVNQTLAKLKVSASSTLDLGVNDGVVLTFNSWEHVGNSVLTIDNWDGEIGENEAVVPGVGPDRLLFTGAEDDFLAQFAQNEVRFIGYAGGYKTEQFGSVFEVTPIQLPEPGALSLLLLGAGGLLARRRRTS